MAKKKLQSDLVISGIAPNLLLKEVENTAPFIFKGELNTAGPRLAFLEKLRFYKKNLNALKHINLSEYFHICLSAHWATAGTFVPTNVDNQIREGLWKHKKIKDHIEKMARLTIDSWSWDYSQVTNRKLVTKTGSLMSTHEGTWLSVAIGAYCALKKNRLDNLADEVALVITEEIQKERELLINLKDNNKAIDFIKAAPLVAHNLGDLDRVMVQWNMHETDSFCQKIFKLGHIENDPQDKIFILSGLVNKAYTSKENHRHMSMRQPKCLRKSYKFLIPVGPFMDEWGTVLGKTDLLNLEEKAEIVTAFYDGFEREAQAFGYVRAYSSLIAALADGLNTLEPYLPFDLVAKVKSSKFSSLALVSKEDFENWYIKDLESKFL